MHISRRFCVFAFWIIFLVFPKKFVFGYSWSTLLWYRCYYPHRSRDALFPVCGIFGTDFKNLMIGSTFIAILDGGRQKSGFARGEVSKGRVGYQRGCPSLVFFAYNLNSPVFLFIP